MATSPITNRPSVEITSSRLLLRAGRGSDIADIREICTQPEVLKYWATEPHDTLAQTKAWYEKTLKSPYRGSSDFVIVHKADNKVIGKAGCWDGREIGFMLNSAYWGKGYASEAMTMVLDHLWNVEGYQVLVADVDPRNEASLKMLKKFGFVETGYEKNTCETTLGWCDSVYLELKRPTIERKVI